MVGHGVRTAKGGKSGKAKSLFIGVKTGNFCYFKAHFGFFLLKCYMIFSSDKCPLKAL